MDHVQKHFDILAPEYDIWKKKNWYYYDAVKKLYGNLIPSWSRVLEIGCGTGEILASLKPVFGIGIDVSGEMIKRAENKYAGVRNLSFQHSDITNFVIRESFDYIFLADVIEHLSDVSLAIRSMERLMHSGTTLIVSMANPVWEPILMLAEKFHMKMPEGPHTRISSKELIHFCSGASLQLVGRDYALLFPKYIPLFSNLVNNIGGRIPFLRRLGVITVFVFKQKERI